MVSHAQELFPGEGAPTAIVAGSGIHLRPLLDEVLRELPFGAVPGLAPARVPGHEGRYVFGRAGGVPVILQLGRIHLYEGHPPEAVAATVDALVAFGAGRLLMTNAAGGLDPALNPGDWVAAETVVPWRYRDHAFPEGLTPAFTLPGCRATGQYMWMHGPCYETRAEIRALQALGGKTVGMSTALELQRANTLGLPAGIVSCVTNNCTTQESLSHDTVVATAARASEEIVGRLRGWLGE